MADEYDATRQLPVEEIVNACRFVNPQSFVEMDVRDPAGRPANAEACRPRT